MKLNLFTTPINEDIIPESFTLVSHPLSLIAVKELQFYLENQSEWVHNFGLTSLDEGKVIGKMFGVLVVETPQKEIGHLWAFSGKLSNSNTFDRFVPPVFDMLAENGFLSNGMEKLAEMGSQIKNLKVQQADGYEMEIQSLKKQRKNHSISLQNKLFENYNFLNQEGEEKSLIAIFNNAGYKNPPAGAGECAAPKLLQYAFQNQLKPLALIEFWWGQSPKSATWKHQHLYAPCREKCQPIFTHMLKGI